MMNGTTEDACNGASVPVKKEKQPQAAQSPSQRPAATGEQSKDTQQGVDTSSNQKNGAGPSAAVSNGASQPGASFMSGLAQPTTHQYLSMMPPPPLAPPLPSNLFPSAYLAANAAAAAAAAAAGGAGGGGEASQRNSVGEEAMNGGGGGEVALPAVFRPRLYIRDADSGVEGIQFDEKEQAWRVTVLLENGVTQCHYFQCKMNGGIEAALEHAAFWKYQQEMERKYQFQQRGATGAGGGAGGGGGGSKAQENGDSAAAAPDSTCKDVYWGDANQAGWLLAHPGAGGQQAAVTTGSSANKQTAHLAFPFPEQDPAYPFLPSIPIPPPLLGGGPGGAAAGGDRGRRKRTKHQRGDGLDSDGGGGGESGQKKTSSSGGRKKVYSDQYPDGPPANCEPNKGIHWRPDRCAWVVSFYEPLSASAPEGTKPARRKRLFPARFPTTAEQALAEAKAFQRQLNSGASMPPPRRKRGRTKSNKTGNNTQHQVEMGEEDMSSENLAHHMLMSMAAVKEEQEVDHPLPHVHVQILQPQPAAPQPGSEKMHD